MSDAEVIFRTGPHRVLESGSVESLDSGGGWGSLVVTHGEALALAKALAQALAEKHRRFREMDEELSTALPEINRLRAENTALKEASRAKDERIAELEEAWDKALDMKPTLAFAPSPDTLHSRDARAAMAALIGRQEKAVDNPGMCAAWAREFADAMAAERQRRGEGES